jgi:hypothetical protein
MICIIMKDFFLKMFSNSEGTSHKRVLGTIGFLSLVVCLFLCDPTHKSDVIFCCRICYYGYGFWNGY